MVFENLKVIHKAFGKGCVVKKDGKYITVSFDNGTEKIFVYPDIFEKFLTPEDTSLVAAIQSDIDAAKSEKQMIIDRKNAENQRAMTHGIVIPGKETAVPENDEDDPRFKSGDPEEV